MPNALRHFAIHADSVERARAFYEAVFGWRFEAWGPPDFYLIHTGSDVGLNAPREVQGALQKRSTPLTGDGMRGFECTLGVDDLDAALAAVVANGGTRLTTPYTIEGVGRLGFIQDTEGNRVGVMQYEVGQPG